MHVIAEIMMPSTIVWLFLEHFTRPKTARAVSVAKETQAYRGIEKCFDNFVRMIDHELSRIVGREIGLSCFCTRSRFVARFK